MPTHTQEQPQASKRRLEVIAARSLNASTISEMDDFISEYREAIGNHEDSYGALEYMIDKRNNIATAPIIDKVPQAKTVKEMDALISEYKDAIGSDEDKYGTLETMYELRNAILASSYQSIGRLARAKSANQNRAVIFLA